MFGNLCLKCPDEIRGKCCYYTYTAYTTSNEKCFILLKHYCPYLNPETKKCNIFKERFKINPYCANIKTSIELGGLIEGCKYLKKHKKQLKESPVSLQIPKNIRSIDIKMIDYLNSISLHDFLRLFYPKLIML